MDQRIFDEPQVKNLPAAFDREIESSVPGMASMRANWDAVNPEPAVV